MANKSAQPITLENDHMILEILPDRGANVCSLKSRATGREWLWRNEHVDLPAPTYGESYIETMDSGGWDEMFPSISPSEITLSDGHVMRVPDHGDLPALACEIERPATHTVRSTIHGRSAPYRFTRALTLMNNRLRADYEVKNTGTANLPWIWFAHPILNLEPGARLITTKNAPFEVTYAEEPSTHAIGDAFAWPGTMTMPVDKRYALKLASARGAVDHFRYETADGAESLRFDWDTEALPYLALWINYGGWHGAGDEPYFNIGIEPATAPDDGLADAMNKGRARWLAQGSVARWSFDLTLEKGIES